MIRKYFNLSTILSRLCAVTLPLLGFGCSSEEDFPCMYGSPNSTFEIKGTVTDEEGRSVPDAIIRISEPEFYSYPYCLKKGLSDFDGSYSIYGSCYPVDSLKVVCKPTDNRLEADSVLVAMDYKKEKEDKGMWYQGHAKATVDFILKKKTGGR